MGKVLGNLKDGRYAVLSNDRKFVVYIKVYKERVEVLASTSMLEALAGKSLTKEQIEEWNSMMSKPEFKEAFIHTSLEGISDNLLLKRGEVVRLSP